MSIRISSLAPLMPSSFWAWAAALGGAAVLSGCVVAPIDDGYGYGDSGYSYSSTTVYTDYGYPPPPRVEYRTVAPSPQHVWIGGDWHWGGSRYDWRPGRWAAPGYRHVAPPPPRPPVMQPSRPPMWHAPRPEQPMVRPDRRPNPPHFEQGQRPQHHQMRPDGDRPPQMRPDRDRPMPQQQARPERPQFDNARPQRGEGGDRRSPPQRRDRDDERR